MPPAGLFWRSIVMRKMYLVNELPVKLSCLPFQFSCRKISAESITCIGAITSLKSQFLWRLPVQYRLIKRCQRSHVQLKFQWDSCSFFGSIQYFPPPEFSLKYFFQIFWSHYRKKVCLSLKPTRKVIQKKGKISATYFPKWRKEINHLQSILHASFLRKKLKLNRNLHKFNWMISPGQRKTNSNIN